MIVNEWIMINKEKGPNMIVREYNKESALVKGKGIQGFTKSFVD
jgi:uncharacterized protein YodC (DUF2158 family)